MGSDLPSASDVDGVDVERGHVGEMPFAVFRFDEIGGLRNVNPRPSEWDPAQFRKLEGHIGYVLIEGLPDGCHVFSFG